MLIVLLYSENYVIHFIRNVQTFATKVSSLLNEKIITIIHTIKETFSDAAITWKKKLKNVFNNELNKQPFK